MCSSCAVAPRPSQGTQTGQMRRIQRHSPSLGLEVVLVVEEAAGLAWALGLVVVVVVEAAAGVAWALGLVVVVVVAAAAGLAWALGSGDMGMSGCRGDMSLGLESLLRRVGGPVGVRAGLWMGGGLEAVCGWGEGGRCFSPEGDGGR